MTPLLSTSRNQPSSTTGRALPRIIEAADNDFALGLSAQLFCRLLDGRGEQSQTCCLFDAFHCGDVKVKVS